MTFDQQIARNIRDRLQVIPLLSDISVVAGNDDAELELPRIVVNCTRGSVAVPGHAVYNVAVEIVMKANAWSAASSDKATTGNQSIELIWNKVENSITGDLSTLSSNSLMVYGGIYDGGISDTREDRFIERTYTMSLIAAPL